MSFVSHISLTNPKANNKRQGCCKKLLHANNVYQQKTRRVMFFLLQKYVIQIKRRHSFHKYAANNILVEILLSNNVVDLMEKISCHYLNVTTYLFG